MDREWVEEAREDERLAEMARLRRRTLGEAAVEAMHAGDRLTIRCGSRSWAGTATAASPDHLELVTPSVRVVANLAGPVTVGRSGEHRGGTTGDRSHRSLRARLATIELADDPVEVVTPELAVPGRLSVVAVDHVVVDGPGGEAWIPLGRLGVVVLP